MSDKISLIMMHAVDPVAITHWEFEQMQKEVGARVTAGAAGIGDKLLLKLIMENHGRYTEAKQKDNALPVYRGRDLPKPGDIIYVRTSIYIDRGEDDVVGGKASVREVKPDKGHNLGWVTVWEHPGHSYGWLSLLEDQAKLEKEFGDKWAYPDPDYG